MRAFYADHKHIRVFVFGTPEGWHTGAYDLKRKQWLPADSLVYDALKLAKTAAGVRLRGLLGDDTQPSLKWH